jgi:UPF0755 protein
MKKIIIGLLIIIIVGVVGCYLGYNYLLSAQNNNGDYVKIYIDEGQTYSTIGHILKENGIIRNELVYKIYVRLNNPKDLEFGEYSINNNLSVEEVIQTLEKGSNTNADTISVTFYEGKNMRDVISRIQKNFNIDESEILNKLKDNNYLDELIEKYWFLTKDIKNNKIYYSLEGYLFPDTYEFYTNSTVEEIFEKLLDNTEKKLEDYKETIEKSKYSIHEIMTLASIIELEAGSSSDRKGVAGVFYNRLEDGWALGSDVTTYYAEKLDNYSRDLTNAEINECNSYNTRSNCLNGKLPVSPICNPGIDSILSSISPKKHNYYYFVADKNGKTYFNKSYSEHASTVSKLKRDGLWIEYED